MTLIKYIWSDDAYHFHVFRPQEADHMQVENLESSGLKQWIVLRDYGKDRRWIHRTANLWISTGFLIYYLSEQWPERVFMELKTAENTVEAANKPPGSVLKDELCFLAFCGFTILKP